MPRILRTTVDWEVLKEALNIISETNNIIVHSFIVIYNTNIKNLDTATNNISDKRHNW